MGSANGVKRIEVETDLETDLETDRICRDKKNLRLGTREINATKMPAEEPRAKRNLPNYLVDWSYR